MNAQARNKKFTSIKACLELKANRGNPALQSANIQEGRLSVKWRKTRPAECEKSCVGQDQAQQESSASEYPTR